MSNEMVTQLPTVTSASLTDIIYAVQGYISPSSPGTSVQETLQQVSALMLANTVLNFAGNPNGNIAGMTYQLCWDTTDMQMYVCTTSGTALTAVWTALPPNSGITTPAHGGTGVSNPTAHTLPVAEGASNFNFLGPLTNGQLLIGSTGADPVAATLTAGPGVSIANGTGSITISGTASGIGWTDVTGASQSMVADNGYTANNAGLVTFTLPATAAYGTGLAIMGKGAGGWTLVFNSGQTVQVGSSTATTTSGSVSSTNRYDVLFMVCTTANTVWSASSLIGNLTIV